MYSRIVLTGFSGKIILTKADTNIFTHVLNLRKVLLMKSSLMKYGKGSGTFNSFMTEAPII